MNLITRVFILSVCVFTVCALPNLGNLHELQDKLIYTFAANSTGNSTAGNNTQTNCSLPGNNTGAGNSTGNDNCTIVVPGNNDTINETPPNSCIVVYSIELNNINAETVVKSEACYVSARLSLAAMNESVIKTKESVNRQSIELQSRLASCAIKLSSEAVFDCYTATFDENLGNLNNITVQSQVASAALSGYEYEVEINTQACIGNVLVESRTNSTLAANDLQVCLQRENNASNITTYATQSAYVLI